jgi:hypothetical protein
MSEAALSSERPQRSDAGGFFTLRKKGQGYWTRLGTAGAGALIILLTGHFFWTQVRARIVFLMDRPNLSVGITVAIVVGSGVSSTRLLTSNS